MTANTPGGRVRLEYPRQTNAHLKVHDLINLGTNKFVPVNDTALHGIIDVSTNTMQIVGEIPTIYNEKVREYICSCVFYRCAIVLYHWYDLHFCQVVLINIQFVEDDIVHLLNPTTPKAT